MDPKESVHIGLFMDALSIVAAIWSQAPIPAAHTYGRAPKNVESRATRNFQARTLAPTAQQTLTSVPPIPRPSSAFRGAVSGYSAERRGLCAGSPHTGAGRHRRLPFRFSTPRRPRCLAAKLLCLGNAFPSVYRWLDQFVADHLDSARGEIVRNPQEYRGVIARFRTTHSKAVKR